MLESIWNLDLPGERWVGKSRLIPVNVSLNVIALTHFLPFQSVAGSCVYIQVCLPEPGWEIRTLFSKYWGSVFWLLIAAFGFRGTGTEAGCHCFDPHQVYWFPRDLKELYLFYLFCCFFSPFFHLGARHSRIRTLKATGYIGEIRKEAYITREWHWLIKDWRRPQAFTSGWSWSLAQEHPLTLKGNSRPRAKCRIWFLEIPYYKFQMFIFQQEFQGIQRNRKIWPNQGNRIN